ncbi:MAG: bifunctional DNA-formamidopyrimidine glycosylase/DNA-(apurinic or apyrimidinic site) lyase [Rhodospirillales bacterium]
MPELPEVETVRRGLLPVLEGRRLERVIQRRPDLRFPMPEGFGQRLTGRTVDAVQRRAKFLMVRISGGDTLIWHLGMSGRVMIFPETPAPPPAAHDHVELLTDGGVTIRFNDARRFGFMDLVAAEDLASYPMLAHLGPEPLDDEFDGAVLAERLRGKNTPIKAALLDQRVVAGIGNIYASEALFRAGISPRRLARTVQGGRAVKLAAAIKAVLAAAIAAGGSTLRDHRQPNGELGYFQHAFEVYDRAGQACPNGVCNAVIRQIVQSGRSTFYCSRCQR